MRISGSRPLRVPPSTRPTLGRARQALFDMLAGGRFGACLPGAIVIDGFAGSGALGLEAWRRGAATIICIDQSATACKTIASNIAALKADAACQVIRHDLTKPLPKSLAPQLAKPATLIFLDPPWQHGQDADLAENALDQLLSAKCIAPSALIVIEHNARTPPTWADAHPQFTLVDMRHWGRVGVVCLRHKDG